MKKFIYLAVASLLISFSVNAQLARTKWAGTMKLPQQDGTFNTVSVEWDFGKDTLNVQIGGGSPEVFTYKDVKKVLTLVKVSGDSPCPEGAKISILYTIKSDIFAFTNQTSDCDTYNKVGTEEPLKKVK